MLVKILSMLKSKRNNIIHFKVSIHSVLEMVKVSPFDFILIDHSLTKAMPSCIDVASLSLSLSFCFYSHLLFLNKRNPRLLSVIILVRFATKMKLLSFFSTIACAFLIRGEGEQKNNNHNHDQRHIHTEKCTVLSRARRKSNK